MPESSLLLARAPVDSIDERDLDLLLLSSIHGSPEFRSALVEKISGIVRTEFVGAWRGAFDQTGEADLLLIVRAADGKRLAVMIEDKIDASFQPDQSARYRLRGERGKVEGHWDSFLTCLCAPKMFASAHVALGEWDRVRFLENIDELLESFNDPFTSFVRGALHRAIHKFEKGGFQPNVQSTAFWRQYSVLRREEFPDLEMTPLRPVQSANDPWPRFAARILQQGVRLEHKAWRGHIDLTFQNRDVRDVRKSLGDYLPDRFSICATPPSAALRLIVPSIVTTSPFDLQVDAVRASFAAVREMLACWSNIRARMTPDIAKANPQSSALRIVEPM
jgi:hypothetical protein